MDESCSQATLHFWEELIVSDLELEFYVWVCVCVCVRVCVYVYIFMSFTYLSSTCLLFAFH